MSETVSNGGQSDRDGNGRFLPGHHSPGPGNPNLATLNKHRAALMGAIKDDDVVQSLAVMVELFRDGKVSPSVRLAAAIAFQNRVLGVPASTEILERIERLEELAERAGNALDSASRFGGNGHD